MLTIENLLKTEYFPMELPKCFSTGCISEKSADLSKGIEQHHKVYSTPIIYSGYKTELSRRKFAVPNIMQYFIAAKEIADNSTEILNLTSQDIHSLTAPQFDPEKSRVPYAKKSSSVSETKRCIEQQYQNNTFEIRIDISSFFDSIYTHTIGWAIHGKALSKKEKDNVNLLGNKLDKVIRNMNNQQTNGLLVGNSLSRIIAEIILCAVDKAIDSDLKGREINYLRYVDDYYFYVTKSEDIQQVITVVRKRLSEFDLYVNETKLQINQAPFIYGRKWYNELFIINKYDFDIRLNKSIELYKQYRDVAIIKYFLRTITVSEFEKDFDSKESKLYNLWVCFPSQSELILSILYSIKDRLHKRKLVSTLQTLIDNCIDNNLEFELIWVVWGMHIMGTRTNSKNVIRILSLRNYLVSIILVDHVLEQKILSKEVINKLKEIYTEICVEKDKILLTDAWLFVYEADVKSWFERIGEGSTGIVDKNQFFRKLKKANVDFYDADYLPSKVKNKRDELLTKKSIQDAMIKNMEQIVSNDDFSKEDELKFVYSILDEFY